MDELTEIRQRLAIIQDRVKDVEPDLIGLFEELLKQRDAVIRQCKEISTEAGHRGRILNYVVPLASYLAHLHANSNPFAIKKVALEQMLLEYGLEIDDQTATGLVVFTLNRRVISPNEEPGFTAPEQGSRPS